MPDTLAPIAVRRASPVAPSTLDREARTVEVIAISGPAPVRRQGYTPDGGFGAWIEELDPASADTSRMVGGPVLADHRPTTDNTVGRVESVRLANGQLLARIRFASTPRADELVQLIADGALTGVSIGYRGGTADAAGRNAEGLPVWRIRGIEILELSLTPIPADADARVRSLNGGPSMPDTITPPARPAGVPAADKVRGLATRAGLPATWAEAHIAAGTPIEEVRAAVLDVLASRTEGGQLPGGGSVQVGESYDAPDHLLERMALGLTYRLRPRGEPAPAAREFVTMSIVDMARTYLSAAGVSVRGSRDQVLARAFATGFHTTSDFPNLLTATGNRLLLDAYEAAPSALKRISRERTAADFRTLTMLRLGEAPALSEIVEGGEVTAGTIAEAKEAFRLKTYGKRFGLSRNALINDDLGAFGDMMAMWGTAAANLEADVLASLLTANSGDGANLDDGNPLYRTARGNKAGSGTVIDVTNLDAARVAMRTVKGLDGVTPINATPRYLVVGPARETQGGQLLSAIMPATAANVNPFAGQLDLLVEPRLTGNAWRLFADPNTLPVLNHAYLNDARGPQVEMQQGWERLAVEVRCILDFGAGLSDWRGTYLNAGA